MNLDISFLPWQQEVWQDHHKYKIIVAGRRCGKTEYAAWSMLIRALTDGLDGERYYVAPTQKQARKAAWKKLLTLGHSVITDRHINNLEITLINGQTISLHGADRPETMRGVSLADCVIDEYGDMKPYVLEEILLPAMTDLDAPLTLIGSPLGRNHFYDQYHKALLGDDEDWAAWHFTSYDNPMLSRALLDKRKKGMSSFAFKQEFMASFEAAGSALFKEEWLKFGEKGDSYRDYYIAVDLAGFENVGTKKAKGSRLDDTAISIVGVNEDGWFVEEIIHGRWDLKETAETIFNAVTKYKPLAVGIEQGIAKQAVASVLDDLMRERQQWFQVKTLTHGNRKKTDRIVWALQGRFENGKITLNKGDWNTTFMDQLFQFPDPLTHDDLIDSLAYIDQLAQVCYAGDVLEYDDFEAFDSVTGY